REVLMASKRLLVAGVAAVLTPLTACGDGSEGADESSITVYNAQHEELLEELAPKFTDETGIEVELRHGEDLELANQIVQEGDKSPADVFLTENSPAMALVDSNDLFAPLDPETLEQVPEQYVADSGTWMGFAARSTVLVYNTDAVSRD